jgi:molybdopterin synthase catalytic subunit
VVALQAERIRVEDLVASVGSGEDGAIALFLGTVRSHNRGRRVLWLEYEAYGEMALLELERIEREARERHGASAVALIHRIGRLEISEISVAVAVAAEHRAEALGCCRFLIDTLKRTVPIWKKEVFEGGQVWIEGSGESRASGDQPKSSSSSSDSSSPR